MLSAGQPTSGEVTSPVGPVGVGYRPPRSKEVTHVTPAERHEVVVRQLVEAFNEKDRGRLVACYSQDLVVHASTGETRTMNHEEHWAEVESMYEVFPDVHARLDHLVGDEVSIFLRGSYTATHEGHAPGSPFEPTGRTATWAWWCEYRFADGVIVEAWNCYDTLTRLIEHGHLSLPEPDDTSAGS